MPASTPVMLRGLAREQRSARAATTHNGRTIRSVRRHRERRAPHQLEDAHHAGGDAGDDPDQRRRWSANVNARRPGGRSRTRTWRSRPSSGSRTGGRQTPSAARMTPRMRAVAQGGALGGAELADGPARRWGSRRSCRRSLRSGRRRPALGLGDPRLVEPVQPADEAGRRDEHDHEGLDEDEQVERDARLDPASARRRCAARRTAAPRARCPSAGCRRAARGRWR